MSILKKIQDVKYPNDGELVEVVFKDSNASLVNLLFSPDIMTDLGKLGFEADAKVDALQQAGVQRKHEDGETVIHKGMAIDKINLYKLIKPEPGIILVLTAQGGGIYKFFIPTIGADFISQRISELK